MAAAYAFHISQNQPFMDGNKRTGYTAALVFLDIDGIRITQAPFSLYEWMISLAEGRIDKGDFANFLRSLWAEKYES